MYIPSEAYSAKITDFQFRLFAILCRSAAPGGLVETTVAQLCIETGKTSDKTIRSALQGLEASGLIETSQTKRANGYLGRKKITVKNYGQNYGQNCGRTCCKNCGQKYGQNYGQH